MFNEEAPVDAFQRLEQPSQNDLFSKDYSSSEEEKKIQQISHCQIELQAPLS
jgi:hypothetical protein